MTHEGARRRGFRYPALTRQALVQRNLVGDALFHADRRHRLRAGPGDLLLPGFARDRMANWCAAARSWPWHDRHSDPAGERCAELVDHALGRAGTGQSRPDWHPDDGAVRRRAAGVSLVRILRFARPLGQQRLRLDYLDPAGSARDTPRYRPDRHDRARGADGHPPWLQQTATRRRAGQRALLVLCRADLAADLRRALLGAAAVTLHIGRRGTIAGIG